MLRVTVLLGEVALVEGRYGLRRVVQAAFDGT
jgi:hypothetical protein